MKKKIHSYEIVLAVLAIIVIAAGLFMPKTGPLVLADEFCDSLVIWILGIWVILRAIRRKGNVTASVKTAKIFTVVVCIAVGLWFTGGVAADLVKGPERAVLSDIQVSKSQTRTGIFSLHYYVTGTDNAGERIRLEISGNDYSKISGRDTIRVEYYKNTRRMVRFL